MGSLWAHTGAVGCIGLSGCPPQSVMCFIHHWQCQSWTAKLPAYNWNSAVSIYNFLYEERCLQWNYILRSVSAWDLGCVATHKHFNGVKNATTCMSQICCIMFSLWTSQHTRNRAEAETCTELRLVLNQNSISLWVLSGLIRALLGCMYSVNSFHATSLYIGFWPFPGFWRIWIFHLSWTIIQFFSRFYGFKQSFLMILQVT